MSRTPQTAFDLELRTALDQLVPEVHTGGKWLGVEAKLKHKRRQSRIVQAVAVTAAVVLLVAFGTWATDLFRQPDLIVIDDRDTDEVGGSEATQEVTPTSEKELLQTIQELIAFVEAGDIELSWAPEEENAVTETLAVRALRSWEEHLLASDMTLILQPDASQEDIARLRQEIESLPQVERYEYLSSDARTGEGELEPSPARFEIWLFDGLPEQNEAPTSTLPSGPATLSTNSAVASVTYSPPNLLEIREGVEEMLSHAEPKTAEAKAWLEQHLGATDSADLAEISLRLPPPPDEPSEAEVVIAVPWGSDLGEVGLEETELGPTGPAVFGISSNGRLCAVYDRFNQRVNLYRDGVAQAAFGIEGIVSSMLVDDEGRFYVRVREDRKEVLRAYSASGEELEETRIDPNQPVAPLFWAGADIYTAGEGEAFGERAFIPLRLSDSRPRDAHTPGYPLGGGLFATLSESGEGDFLLKVYSQDEQVTEVVLSAAEQSDRGAALLDGSALGGLPVVHFVLGQTAPETPPRSQFIAVDYQRGLMSSALVELDWRIAGGGVVVGEKGVYVMKLGEEGMRIEWTAFERRAENPLVSDAGQPQVDPFGRGPGNTGDRPGYLTAWPDLSLEELRRRVVDQVEAPVNPDTGQSHVYLPSKLPEDFLPAGAWGEKLGSHHNPAVDGAFYGAAFSNNETAIRLVVNPDQATLSFTLGALASPEVRDNEELWKATGASVMGQEAHELVRDGIVYFRLELPESTVYVYGPEEIRPQIWALAAALAPVAVAPPA